jgi:hypothetical protein
MLAARPQLRRKFGRAYPQESTCQGGGNYRSDNRWRVKHEESDVVVLIHSSMAVQLFFGHCPLFFLVS